MPPRRSPRAPRRPRRVQGLGSAPLNDYQPRRGGNEMTTAVASLTRSALDKNQELSRAAEGEGGLPSDKPLWQHFERQAGQLIRSLPDGATAVDLGGGRRCVYAQALRPDQDVRLVAVDIDEEELALNQDVAETRVANVAEGLPFDDASVD